MLFSSQLLSSIIHLRHLSISVSYIMNEHHMKMKPVAQILFDFQRKPNSQRVCNASIIWDAVVTCLQTGAWEKSRANHRDNSNRSALDLSLSLSLLVRSDLGSGDTLLGPSFRGHFNRACYHKLVWPLLYFGNSEIFSLFIWPCSPMHIQYLSHLNKPSLSDSLHRVCDWLQF